MNTYGGTHPPDATPIALGPVLPLEPPLAALALATARGCVPPSSASSPPSLRAAVAEIFDAAGPGAKVTHKRAARYLAANYPELHYNAAALNRVLQLVRQERQRQHKLAALANLTLPGLKAQLRLAEHLAEKSRAVENGAWRWWEVYANYVRDELKRRPAESATARRQGIVEAVPNPREIGQAHQLDLLDQIAEQRQPSVTSVPRAVKLTQPLESTATTGEIPTWSAKAWGLIERLQVLRTIFTSPYTL